MAEVVIQGRRRPVPDALVRRAVGTVLAGERRAARISVTFLGRDAMRSLNRRHLGHDRPTDVVSFALDTPEGLVGDVYVCPWVAVREARARRLPLRQEVVRLVVHGTLHVLGFDHPAGEARTGSAMWRRQERYVARVA
ncbi:MAG TPA: rRNA maturation RNase YbeY [Gemmatimonadales bacterium]|nr:rRNA maturation RNase YbeY [Gemmatimonadales bacterium]